MKRLYLSCMLGLITFCVNAQDIHYSQFFNSPLNLNPALTGVIQGQQRLSANYKSQWASVPVDYNTYTLEYDRNFASPSDTTGFFSIGAIINYDKAGAVNLNLLNIGLSASYSVRLNSDSYITPGIQLAFNSRKIDWGKAITGNQYDPDLGTANLNISPEILSDNGISFADVTVGLNYHRQKSYRNFLDVGAAVFHLLMPNQSFDASFTSNLNRKLSVYAMGSRKLLDRVDLLLNGLYSNQVTYQEIVLNAQGKIYLNKNKERNTALYLGLGYRVGDAFYPMIAVQYQNIYVGFNYDINISDFSHATGNNGGPEFSFRYLLYNVPLAPFKPCPIY